MSVRRHLRCRQCDRCRAACLFHRVKVTVRRTNPHRHTSRTPGNPGSAKVGRWIGGIDAHIDASHRIHRFDKGLDIIFQKFPIHPDIPVLRNLKGIIHLRHFPDCHAFSAPLKVHDYSSRRNDVLDGNGGKGIRQGVFDIIGSLRGNRTAAKRKYRTGAESGTGIRPRSIRCFLIIGGTGDGVFSAAGSVGIRN